MSCFTTLAEVEPRSMTLPELLLSDERRADIVRDCVQLVDSEVARRRGVSGFALRNGYKMVKKLQGGRMIPTAVNDLLPDFATAMEPFHAEYRATGGGSFAQFMRGKEGGLSDALLRITDEKAHHAENRVLKGVYEKLRPTAKKNLDESMPEVTKLIDRHQV